MPHIKNSKVHRITMIALLLASGIVLSRFLSIETPIVKIGFSFVPLVIAARYFGTKTAMIVSGLGDLIGAMLFPFGPYFVGYTLSETLRGFIFGKMLSKKFTFTKLVISVVLTQILCSLLLNSLCMTIFYENFRAFTFEKYLYFLSIRAVQTFGMIVVEIIVSYPLVSRFDKIFTNKQNFA